MSSIIEGTASTLRSCLQLLLILENHKMNAFILIQSLIKELCWHIKELCWHITGQCWHITGLCWHMGRYPPPPQVFNARHADYIVMDGGGLGAHLPFHAQKVHPLITEPPNPSVKPLSAFTDDLELSWDKVTFGRGGK